MEAVFNQLPVVGITINLFQTLGICRGFGELHQDIADGGVVNLTDTTHIPSSEILHVVVHEELVRVYIVSPTVQSVSSPSIFLLVDCNTANQELFHCTSVNLAFSVQLSVTLEDDTHCLAVFLFIFVPRITGRFLALRAIHTENVLDKPAYKVVLQRLTALLSDILVLRYSPHSTAFGMKFYHIPPLVSIIVPLVSQSTLTEILHVVVIPLGLKENGICTLIRLTIRVERSLDGIKSILVHHLA